MTGTVERPYRRSHPWLTFGRIDLSHTGSDFWMLLGEARSKIEHLSMALLRPEAAEQMLQVYLARGVHATTAIEGNTLSEDDVVDVLEGRAAPSPSQAYLFKEVENIISAYNQIKNRLVAGGNLDLKIDQIKLFNAEVLDGIDERGVKPGEVRTGSVLVGNRYRGAPAEDCEYLLERLCHWINGPDFEPRSDDYRLPFALIKAIIAHLYFVWIHPFDNGNGRTARLIELQILMASGVPMPAAHLLSNHYNVTRDEYYRQLQRASDSGGDVSGFLRYATQGFVDGIRSQLLVVWDTQYRDRWEQFIYQAFGGHPTSTAEKRRLTLVLALSDQFDPEGVTRRGIAELDPALTLAYAGTERMLSRDLNALETMRLVYQPRHGRWAAWREQILAFRPVQRLNV